jgi:hypothetical protein
LVMKTCAGKSSTEFEAIHVLIPELSEVLWGAKTMGPPLANPARRDKPFRIRQRRNDHESAIAQERGMHPQPPPDGLLPDEEPRENCSKFCFDNS